MPGWERKYGKLDQELDCYLEHSKKSDESEKVEVISLITIILFTHLRRKF